MWSGSRQGQRSQMKENKGCWRRPRLCGPGLQDLSSPPLAPNCLHYFLHWTVHTATCTQLSALPPSPDCLHSLLQLTVHTRPLQLAVCAISQHKDVFSNKSRQGNEDDYVGRWRSGSCWGVRVSGLILQAAGSPLRPSTKRLLGLRYFGGQCRTAWCKEAFEAGSQGLDTAGGRQRGEGHREGQEKDGEAAEGDRGGGPQASLFRYHVSSH